MPRRTHYATHRSLPPLEPRPPVPRLSLAEALARLVRRGELCAEEAAALWCGEDSEETQQRLQQEPPV